MKSQTTCLAALMGATLGLTGLMAGPAEASLQIQPNATAQYTDTFKTEAGQGVPTGVGGFVNGQLFAVDAGLYEFTYLGAGNATDANQFTVGGNSFCNKPGMACGASATAVGTSFQVFVAANTLISFSFIYDQTGATGGPHALANGGWDPSNGSYLAQVGLGSTPNAGPGTVAYLGLSDEAYFVNGVPGDRDFQDLTVRVTQVPEPATLALFGTALLGLGMVRRRAAGR